jgi:hypothetical protein
MQIHLAPLVRLAIARPEQGGFCISPRKGMRGSTTDEIANDILGVPLVILSNENWHFQ